MARHEQRTAVLEMCKAGFEARVSLTRHAFEAIEKRLQRNEHLPKYHVVIRPAPA